jgi:hypothetical protein
MQLGSYTLILLSLQTQNWLMTRMKLPHKVSPKQAIAGFSGYVSQSGIQFAG